jgi:hypothetical protein
LSASNYKGSVLFEKLQWDAHTHIITKHHMKYEKFPLQDKWPHKYRTDIQNIALKKLEKRTWIPCNWFVWEITIITIRHTENDLVLPKGKRLYKTRQKNWPPQYNWNIVKSVKLKPTPIQDNGTDERTNRQEMAI